MDNFTWYNPTKIIFGRKTHQQVGQITAAYAKRVLLVYGGRQRDRYGKGDRTWRRR